jgi:hypothetical protein
MRGPLPGDDGGDFFFQIGIVPQMHVMSDELGPAIHYPNPIYSNRNYPH